MADRGVGRVAFIVGLALALPLAYPLNALLTPDVHPEPIRVVPSLGVAAAAALAWPRRRADVLLAVALAPFLVLPVLTDRPPIVIVGLAVAGTTQVAIVVFGLRHLLGDPVEIRRPWHAVALLCTALAAAAVGATLAELPPTLVDDATTPTDTRWVSWSSSFFVETAVFVPAALALRMPSARLRSRAGRIEAAIALACLAGVLAVAGFVEFVAAFTVAPIAVWLAIRFGSRLAAPAVALSTVAITAIGVRGSGGIQGRLPTPGWAAFAMALVAATVVTTALAQQAADDRSHLSTTLSAVTDVVALTHQDGRIIESWGTSADGVTADELGSIAAGATDDRGRRSISMPSGRTLEHTWMPAPSDRAVHVVRDVTTRQLLRSSRSQRRRDVDRARRAEQEALGARLHDGPIQDLSALLLQFGRLRAAGTSTGAAADIDVLEGRLAATIADLRNLVDLLVPIDVGAGRLAPALADLAARLLDARTVVSIDDSDWRAPPAAERDALYLVGKEALANAAVHARPEEVRITLRADASGWSLSVADDGPGMTTPSAGRRHLGIDLMRQRVRAFGGSLELRRGALGGLEVVAHLPAGGTVLDLDAEAAAAADAAGRALRADRSR